MDSVNCTGCGKVLLDGDWKSKSGLCRACAEAKHDAKNKSKYVKWLIISVSALILVWISIVIFSFYGNGSSVTPSDDIADKFLLAGYSDQDDHAIFLGVTESEADWGVRAKKFVASSILVKYDDEYPDIDTMTILLVLDGEDTPYECFVYENGEVYDLDPLLGMAALGSMSEQ